MLYSVAVNVFEKTLHGFVRLADIFIKRKLRLAGRAMHVDFVTAAANMQPCPAAGADKRGFGITGGEKSHGQLLFDVAIVVPLVAPKMAWKSTDYDEQS